ncbi:MAG: DUF3604 domain-containing protein [Bacteroidetes bacterium]|nr:DUF3604 domain-containing protein [Bacteroidota bacterium]
MLGYLTRSSSWLIGAKPAGTSTCTVPPSNTFGGSASAGWANGHRFGVIGSTDHHGGYPGSHGDGRVAVWASNLTREAIWEALLARRVYADTGDKIEAKMLVVGNHPLGLGWRRRRS